MVWVATLLLPLMSLLLLLMDRLEDQFLSASSVKRRRARHLRLVPGGRWRQHDAAEEPRPASDEDAGERPAA
ncbi:hypothetical protein ACL02U_03305 [Streptomyces sp. MS06]|uniref:hypothetical protein n=1 Tax=Streptomyces sp. MS06 TaxID=3385974 RepID=UPI0039A2AC98